MNVYIRKKMKKNKTVFIAGHNGMVGSALLRELKNNEYSRSVITASRKQIDLTNQSKVNTFISEKKPDEIIIAAARVGGIVDNSDFAAEYIYQNLLIASNLIHAAYKNKVGKVLFLGSTCIYPKNANQPMSENELLSGPMEETNQWYAIAKIAGVKLCQAYNKQYGCNFISAMPTNLYGIKDNFNIKQAHVIPALMHRAYLAKLNNDKELIVWGSGKPTREFLFVDDLAKACFFLLDNYSENKPINVGTGKEITIKNLVTLICDIVGFKGKIIFDQTKPDGHPRKVSDVSKMNNLGWKSKIELNDGLKISYNWFIDNYKKLRK